MYAAIGGATEAVKALLDKGAEVNGKFNNGETALTAAAFAGREEVVRTLLAKGADVNARCTALTLAEGGGYTKVVEILKAAGAKWITILAPLTVPLQFRGTMPLEKSTPT